MFTTLFSEAGRAPFRTKRWVPGGIGHGGLQRSRSPNSCSGMMIGHRHQRIQRGIPPGQDRPGKGSQTTQPMDSLWVERLALQPVPDRLAPVGWMDPSGGQPGDPRGVQDMVESMRAAGGMSLGDVSPQARASGVRSADTRREGGDIVSVKPSSMTVRSNPRAAAGPWLASVRQFGRCGVRLAIGLACLLLLPPFLGRTCASEGAGRESSGSGEAASAGPGGARGYEKPPSRTGQRAGLLLPRLVLLPARIGIQVATFPVRVLTGMTSSQGLIDRVTRGVRLDQYIVPVVGLDPTLGRNAGFRAGHLNPFHSRSCVTYRAAYGGTKEQVYALTFRNRNPRKAGWSYRLTAKYEIIPDHNYFGIGNTTDRDHWTYYTQERYLFLGKLGWAPRSWMRWDLAVAIHRNQIGPAAYLKEGQNSIEDIHHSESMAPGLWVDPQNIWGEIALTLDRRNHVGRPTAGWWAEGYYGRANGTGSDGSNYVRYGGEAQAYIPLGGARVLVLRLAGEEARTAETDPIKFTELPSLGGRSTLRGYLDNRFRDNASMLSTFEYRYPISPFAEVSLYGDFGKVAPRLLDMDLKDVHRSWGGGLRIARDEQFLFRLYAAASDEDVIFWGTLECAFEREDRRDRR